MSATGSIGRRFGTVGARCLAALALLLVAFQAPPPNLQSGLIAYWKLDETSGTSAADSAGTNTGTHFGNPAITTSGLPPAIKFSDPACRLYDAVDDYTTCGTSATLGPAQMTVSFWSKAVSVYSYDGLMAKTNGDAWTVGWGFYYDLNLNASFFVGQWDVGVATAPINLAIWNHWVGTWDGSTVQIYINGAAGTPSTYSGGPTGPANPFEIGRVGPSYPSNGQLDDVRIYNRVLTAAEINLLFQGWGGPPSTPTGLTATPGFGQVSLSWNAASAATTYTLYRSTTSGSGYATVASGLTSLAYVDAPRPIGTYYYVVSASNPAGTSPNSTEATAIVTSAPAPSAGGGKEHESCGCGTAGVPGPGVLLALAAAALLGLAFGRRPS